jgi:hypothetical protein
MRRSSSWSPGVRVHSRSCECDHISTNTERHRPRCPLPCIDGAYTAVGEVAHTLPLSSAPYGGFSSAPCRAPSLSPPRSSCRICWALFWTSSADTGATAGVRELRSKLAGLSGSRASMLIVRQLMLAMAEAVRYRKECEGVDWGRGSGRCGG